ncbi:MAG: PorT family protein [Crocinitomicaceae bacterium]|nr:PorT family protein [Crocinitomicaceae bacterium]
MNKVLLIIILVIGGGAKAQLQVGPKLGYNYVSVGYKDLPTGIATPEAQGAGFHIGGFVQYEAVDNFFLGSDVLFSSRAYNEISITNEQFESIHMKRESFGYYSTFYLDIPVFAKYAINLKARKYGTDKFLCFYGGPMPSIFLSGSGRVQETTRTDLYDQTTTYQTERELSKSGIKERFKLFHLGVHAGLQFSLDFGLNFDVRYTRSVTSINKNLTEEGNMSNGMIQLSVGYNILAD